MENRVNCEEEEFDTEYIKAESEDIDFETTREEKVKPEAEAKRSISLIDKTQPEHVAFDEPQKTTKVGYALSQRMILCILSTFAVLLSSASRGLVRAVLIGDSPKRNFSHPPEDNCLLNADDIGAGEELVSLEMFPTPAFKHDGQLNYRLKHEWDLQDQKLFISSFYWGSLIMQIPGGYMADYYGGKHLVTFAIFGTSAVALVYPVAVRLSLSNVTNILGLRFVNGLFQGTIHPAVASMLSKWIPPNERATMFCFVYGASSVGTLFVRFLGLIMIGETKLWQSIFYAFGGLGLFWCLLWNVMCYSTPQSSRFISAEEKMYLVNNIGQCDRTKMVVPWNSIFRSLPLWTLMASTLGFSSVWFLINQNLSKYTNEVLKLPAEFEAYFASIPFALCWITSILCGSVSDWLIAERHVKPTLVRKACTFISMIGTAIMLVMAAIARCEKVKAVVCFSTAVACLGGYFAGAFVSVLDLAPNFAGCVMGLMNAVSVIVGMTLPLLIGLMAPHNTLGEWQQIFWLTFFVLAFCALTYLVLGSAAEEQWNKF